jgi:hypothetical protein
MTSRLANSRLISQAVLWTMVLGLAGWSTATAAPRGPRCCAAASRRGHPPPWELWREPKVVRTLALTRQQTVALQKLDRDVAQQMRVIQVGWIAAERQLERAFSRYPVDERAVRIYGGEVATSMASAHKVHLSARLRLHAILTEEQLSALRTLRPAPNRCPGSGAPPKTERSSRCYP